MSPASGLEFDRHIRWRVATCFKTVSNLYNKKRLRLPNAAQANERGPRSQNSAFLMNLLKYRSLDEVYVATEGYNDRRVRWGLWSL
jgi:hypothetical protein